MISNSDESGGCESGKGGEARCGGRTDFVVVAEHIATVEKHHGGINVVVFVVVRHLITNTFQTSELAVYHRRHFSMFSQSHRQKMTPNENSNPLQSYYGLPITCRFFRTKWIRRLSNRNVAVRFSFFSLPIP